MKKGSKKVLISIPPSQSLGKLDAKRDIEITNIEEKIQILKLEISKLQSELEENDQILKKLKFDNFTEKKTGHRAITPSKKQKIAPNNNGAIKSDTRLQKGIRFYSNPHPNIRISIEECEKVKAELTSELKNAQNEIAHLEILKSKHRNSPQPIGDFQNYPKNQKNGIAVIGTLGKNHNSKNIGSSKQIPIQKAKFDDQQIIKNYELQTLKLNEEIEQLKKKTQLIISKHTEEIEKFNEKYELRISSLTEELDRLNKESELTILTLTQEIKLLNEKSGLTISNLTEEKKKLNKLIINAQEENLALEKNQNEKDKIYNLKISEIKQSSIQEKELLAKQISELTTKNQELENYKKPNEQSLVKEIESLKSEVANLTREATIYRDNNIDLTNRLQVSNQNLIQIEEESKKEISTMNSEIIENKSEIERLRKLMDNDFDLQVKQRYESEIAGMMQNSKRLSEENQNLVNEIGKLKEKFETKEIFDDIIFQKKIIDRLTKENEDLKIRIRHLIFS